MLYFIGWSQMHVVHGQQCEVMGPDVKDSSRLRMMFSGNKDTIGCPLDQISRTPLYTSTRPG